jgi:lysylphosphatidylglycerol synthetase-like protein (DUF2156 family)
MRYLPVLIVVFMVFSGVAAHAVDTPIEGTAIDIKDIENLIQDVANFFLTVAGIVAVGFMVYGGVQMVTSRGNDTKFGEGKKTLTNAIIGAVVIFAVGIIINTIAQFGEDPTSIF